MKKIIAATAAALMICSAFTACGRNRNDSSDAGYNSSEEGVTPTGTADETTTDTTESMTENNTDEDRSGRPDSAGDYVSGVIDGVESAGEDIVEGAGDAAGEIADGVMGEDSTESTTTDDKDRKKSDR